MFVKSTVLRAVTRRAGLANARRAAAALQRAGRNRCVHVKNASNAFSTRALGVAGRARGAGWTASAPHRRTLATASAAPTDGGDDGPGSSSNKKPKVSKA